MSYVFVDMDGVLVNFVDGLCAAHGRPNPYEDPANHGIFEMDKIWGMSAEDFWIRTLGKEFWANLDKMPDADNILVLAIEAVGPHNVCILTAPSQDPECIAGKREWVAHHYPRFRQQMLFGSAKRFLAGPGRVLIDDKVSNILEFRESGGAGVLVPRPWNTSTRDESGDPAIFAVARGLAMRGKGA